MSGMGGWVAKLWLWTASAHVNCTENWSQVMLARHGVTSYPGCSLQTTWVQGYHGEKRGLNLTSQWYHFGEQQPKKSFQVPLITRHTTSLRFTSIGGIYLLEESMGPGLSPISCSSLRISSGEREESSSSYLLVSAAAPPLAGRLRGGIVSPFDCPLRISCSFVNAQA